MNVNKFTKGWYVHWLRIELCAQYDLVVCLVHPLSRIFSIAHAHEANARWKTVIEHRRTPIIVVPKWPCFKFIQYNQLQEYRSNYMQIVAKRLLCLLGSHALHSRWFSLKWPLLHNANLWAASSIEKVVWQVSWQRVPLKLRHVMHWYRGGG